jgi:phage tail sheath protein FI
MAVQVSYPGVYVQEESSGARAIAGVATSVAMFVGMAERGPMNVPVRVFNIAGFEREFGVTTRGELATQVRQFFINGGGTAWIGRIAEGALNAWVSLRNQAGGNAFRVEARDPGLEGNRLRVEIDYDTSSPEETFNLTAFRSRLKPDGTRERESVEKFAGLSMNPNSGAFVSAVINGASILITISNVAPVAIVAGVSISGLVLPAAEASVETLLNTLVTASARSLRVTVANHPPVTVSLSTMADIPASNLVVNIANRWTSEINGALSNQGIAATVTVAISGNTVALDGVAGGRLLSVSSTAGPVQIGSAAAGDVAAALQFGIAAGGLEGSGFGDARPAPTGVVARMGLASNRFAEFRTLAGQLRNTLTAFSLSDDSSNPAYAGPVVIDGVAAQPLFQTATGNSLANVRSALDTLAARISETAQVPGNPRKFWFARRHGIRLALSPNYGGDNTGLGTALTSSDGGGGGYNFGTTAFAPAQASNVAVYTVGMPGGAGGLGTFQAAPQAGTDGNLPRAVEYSAFFDVIDRDVDLFNLMVLPRAHNQTDDQRQELWGLASSFCARKRAFLLVDPRSTWANITQAEAGADALRIGVDTRNSAAYWPRLRIANGTPAGQIIDPAGSIAGLIARTDGNRGVWKAPAGLEATLRGVSGVDRRMSDPENGVINPKALNAIRLFPAGVVSWGARTLVGFDGSGNIDDKYIPVRRTMLFIEESLYRGLHFAVFEPNDEPLWAQIRLAAGSFMNGLFRKGAFAGAKASDAYFVRCDSSTTTADDINLGIVNVVVGFAPLKPAEFVVLTVKQIAAQAEI